METYDAVVIGGGVIGTSIAYRLAETRHVLLVEKTDIGAQTSGACDKAIFLQSKKPGFPIKLAKASRQIYENLEEELETSIEFHKGGGMIVIEDEDHIEFMESFVKKQQKAGIDVTLLDSKEARSIQPSLAEYIVGATYSKEDAEVNPLKLSQAFAQAAKRRGVDIRTHTEVIDIDIQNGKVVGVKTTSGYIATELVVNAGGPFAGKIAEMAGVGLTIMPRRGVILISEKINPMIFGNILCSQYIAAKHQTDEENKKKPPYGIGLSLGQTKSGNLLIGGSREFKGFQKAINDEILAAIARHATRIAPAIKPIRIIRSMVGFRPYTGDGLPIIDKVEGVEGFVIAAGHEGDGIALAPITGKLVVSLVENRKEDQSLLKPLQFKRLKAV
ncbi:NAD(P)/FAD-dependent oxidoreductase [Oceanobacillus halotolerans]|uniref:NAD(P)/FAD-dependent oxidoreductase n=1 Tax=Oceanobacillus halotolerans TaxID=2663380 RepID=UPI0013DA15E2|nr:FAD-dependent oxidoreductase [Oceanobacillus halotolerans]